MFGGQVFCKTWAPTWFCCQVSPRWSSFGEFIWRKGRTPGLLRDIQILPHINYNHSQEPRPATAPTSPHTITLLLLIHLNCLGKTLVSNILDTRKVSMSVMGVIRARERELDILGFIWHILHLWLDQLTHPPSPSHNLDLSPTNTPKPDDDTDDDESFHGFTDLEIAEKMMSLLWP